MSMEKSDVVSFQRLKEKYLQFSAVQQLQFVLKLDPVKRCPPDGHAISPCHTDLKTD